jgi:hypothetical protein
MSKTENFKNEDKTQTKSILSINDFALDKCPKCKKTICNHTSVANFHTFLRADEDISIYSSDFTFKITNDNKFTSKDDDDYQSIYIKDSKKTRPISCNVVVIDRNKNEKNNRFIISRKSYNELILGKDYQEDSETEDTTTICSGTISSKNNIILFKSSNIAENGKYNLKTRFQESNEPCFESLFIFPDYLSNAYRKDIRVSYFNTQKNPLIKKLLNVEQQSNSKSKIKTEPFITSYHSISMILIIMLLYTINILQEYFILFDYFNTKKYYWCIFSLFSVIISQFFIIACIYLNNDSKEITKTFEVISNNMEQHNFITEPFNFKFIHDGHDFAFKKYSFFFSRFFILIFIPGLLPAIVYFQLMRYLLNFKKLSCLNHFKSEFSLSFYLLISSLFHSLPLAITNSCFLATKFSFVSFSFASEMLTLNPILTEKREALVILVSIFISITVGICLFTSYYHLMKHIYDTSRLIDAKIRQSYQQTFLFSCFTISFVHFCYKFCFITSRVVIIAILWYLISEKLFIILTIHLLIGYFLCNFKYQSVKTTASMKKCKFSPSQHFSCLVISLLSFTDTFVDIIDRFQYFFNIHLYYLIYFIQNVSVILIWFYKVMINMQQYQNVIYDKELYIVSKELKKDIFINDDWLSNSIQTIYSIIFLSVIICLLIVGTILRYILTNMSQKLFKRINEQNMV